MCDGATNAIETLEASGLLERIVDSLRLLLNNDEFIKVLEDSKVELEVTLNFVNVSDDQLSGETLSAEGTSAESVEPSTGGLSLTALASRSRRGNGRPPIYVTRE